jgi:hypothetical protein
MRSNGKRDPLVKQLTRARPGAYAGSVVERKEVVFMKVQLHTSRLGAASS